jgi:hypothetical protein
MNSNTDVRPDRTTAGAGVPAPSLSGSTRAGFSLGCLLSASFRRAASLTTATVTGVGLALVLGACGSGSSGGGGSFLVLRTTPQNNGRLFLNEPIRIDFNTDVNLSTADLNTVSFQVFDQNGQALTERPAGTFSIGTTAGDQVPGRQLVFTPRFPTNNTYDNGGFRPGRTYVVQLVSGDQRNNTVLRSVKGNGLTQAVSFTFQTAAGTTPSQLFSDTRAGGPRVVSMTVTPSDSQGVSLNRLGREPVEVRLTFDQPLNPSDSNVPVSVSADPLVRLATDRGRISLEYTDTTVSPLPIWFPATVDLESNTRQGAVVVLRPLGILPNNATISVRVERSVEDMSGESNIQNAAYDPVVGTFDTRQDFAPQFDAIVDDFSDAGNLDSEAAFLEAQAGLAGGRLSASFDFEGGETRLTYRPAQREVTLNTDLTLISPENGPPINVAGGVFTFARVEIPENVVVRGTGTRPMQWLVTGDFIVNGLLTIEGGDGQRVDTLNSANFPTGGGVGQCGGGNGGLGSPSSVSRSPSGEAGFGPGNKPQGGGEPGLLSCTSNCGRGSAGGGGSFSTQGDPFYPPTGANRPAQASGTGGAGCTTTAVNLPGGAPGVLGFVDTRADNNFWGSGVNVFEGIRVRGELIVPRGGSGGGGGGDKSTSGCETNSSTFINDAKGGGGGAGGGILIVKCLGTIRIGPFGRISANGGNGGGGEQAGGNTDGGGGGAGSGGMVVLMAGKGFEIFAHGPNATTNATYAENNFDFAITADGGLGLQGTFGGNEIRAKYPIPTFPARPLGGFGGMGVIQMMAPPGDDQVDGTGNRLDDNINFVFLDGSGVKQSVSPARKRQLLGWRGWPTNTGSRIDDLGNPITLREGEGDIRPSPILLPSPFAPQSRARSQWIELGSANRRRVDAAPAPNTPRVVVAAAGTEPRPDFGDDTLGFAGTSTTAGNTGYASFDRDGNLTFPVISIGGQTSLPVTSVSTDATLDGQPAYLVELAGSVNLGSVEDRYLGYRLELQNGSGGKAEFRILKHNARFVFLAPEATVPSATSTASILAKFFDVETNGNQGLGPTFNLDGSGTNKAPRANVRIGFAFSTDPRTGFGAQRWPNGTVPTEELYEYDLRNPAFLAWLQSNQPTFVQWDVTFNTTYHPTNPGNLSGEALSANTPRPSLRFLALPYRF